MTPISPAKLNNSPEGSGTDGVAPSEVKLMAFASEMSRRGPPNGGGPRGLGGARGRGNQEGERGNRRQRPDIDD